MRRIRAFLQITIIAVFAITLIGPGTAFAAGRKKPRVTKNNNVMVLEYDFDQPQIAAKGDFDLISIDGLRRYAKPGEPVLPVMPVEILVPAGMKIVKITSTPIDPYQLDGTYSLSNGHKPRRKPQTGEIAEPFIPTEPNPEIFGMTEFWPAQQHELVTVQTNRGYNIAHVNLFPVQYSPMTGIIKTTTKMQLTVRLTGAGSHRRARPTKYLKKTLARNIDNPDDVESYDTMAPAESSGLDATTSASLSSLGGPYKYVVITNASLAGFSNPNSFQALCDSKIIRGITAGIVTTEDIYANYTGDDDQDKIRNFLTDAYETWETEYALLGGNKDIIPVRLLNDGEDIPSDMYYGCVDPSGAFDGTDLTAEIAVGRASVENTTDIANFVNKTLVYGSTDDPYLDYALSSGAYLWMEGDVPQYTKPYAEFIKNGSDLYTYHFTCGFPEPPPPYTRDFDNLRNFNVSTLYEEDWAWTAPDLVAILNGEGDNITPQIVYISDHGSTTTGMANKFDIPTLLSLNNTNPFFFYDDSCDVGHFDSANCFSEVATTMEHGAFACITNSRSGWGGTDENPLDSPTTLLTREFYHSFLGEGVFELGRAHAEAKERCIWTISTTRYDIYQSTLFGDPELKLRVTNEHACGDLDRSGDKVNLADFAEMAKCWDSDPTVDPSCANANLVEFDKHIIDLLDLQVLAELFLTVPTNYFPNCPTSITDPYPPSPATMSFATVPYATGDSSIEMVATTATDISGVEYYFTCTIGDGNDSGWQASRTYEDTGLSPATGYTYTVKAHDLSVNYRETAASSPALATTYSSDSTAPDPDPMSFATAPYATGSTSIMMVATTATDISGVEYYFTNTTIGDESHDSGWQPGTIYEDTGLTPETEYTYTVTAHDKSADENPTAASGPASATTDMANIVLSANGGFLEESLSDYTEYDGYGPSYLTDGVTNDVVGWCSKTTSPSTQEFVFSFRDGKNATLGNAVLHTGIPDGNYYSKDVEVWTSTDGSTFTLAGFDALEAVDNDSTAIDLGDVIAEYVKLVITSSHGTSYWELAEFEVYGTIIE